VAESKVGYFCFWYPNVVVESLNVFGYWLALFSCYSLNNLYF